MGPLFVELEIEGEKGMEEFPGIFTEIHRGPSPRVAVRVGLFPGASAAFRWGYPVDLVWELDPPGPLDGHLPEGAAAASICPDDEAMDLLPEIIESFADSRVGELHLTNVNAVRSLARKGYVPIASPERIRAVSERISDLRVSLSGKKLIVHDYFLWRALKGKFPRETGGRVEFSGCQAASGLVYIDWDGNVYPCDSLPVRLGNLLETPFDRIWNSPARSSLLAGIRSAPAACSGCGSYEGCLAACRGLAYIASGDAGAPDPGCPGPGSKLP
jgi:GeoRSP system SPASM domain protein